MPREASTLTHTLTDIYIYIYICGSHLHFPYNVSHGIAFLLLTYRNSLAYRLLCTCNVLEKKKNDDKLGARKRGKNKGQQPRQN